MRQIKLINGDRFKVEVLSSIPGALEVRWFGQVRFLVPISVIDRVVCLPGERDLANEHFGSQTLDSRDRERSDDRVDGVAVIPPQTGARRLPLPQTDGDFRLSLRFRVPDEFRQNSVRWTIQFSDQQQLQVRCHPDGVWRVNDSLIEATQRQSVPETAGWHTLRLQRETGRIFLSLDQASLFSGKVPAGILSGCEMESSEGSVWIDQWTLVARNQPTLDLPSIDGTDAVIGAGGEVWWGDLQTVGPDDVTWTNGGETWRRSWRELQGVRMGQAPRAMVGEELHGCMVMLRSQPLSDRPDLPGDRLSASLGGCRDGFVELHHPLLGRLVIPQPAIQRVEHRWTGRAQVLDARESSLGTPPGEFRSPRLEGQFLLDRVPLNEMHFAAEFSGLEPSGPETPPGSRSLKSLRAEKLVTELFVNDRLVGNFNELTSGWSLPGEFDRLRLKVPTAYLRPGENFWRITQQSGDGPRRTFDECQIRNIGWESR